LTLEHSNKVPVLTLNHWFVFLHLYWLPLHFHTVELASYGLITLPFQRFSSKKSIQSCSDVNLSIISNSLSSFNFCIRYSPFVNTYTVILKGLMLQKIKKYYNIDSAKNHTKLLIYIAFRTFFWKCSLFWAKRNLRIYNNKMERIVNCEMVFDNTIKNSTTELVLNNKIKSLYIIVYSSLIF